MRTIVGVLSKIEELQKTKKNLLRQQRFLYPLLFQEDLYAIAYNRFLNKTNLKKLENSNSNKKFSFLTLKRLIFRIRQKIILQKSNKFCNKTIDINYESNFYSTAIREGVTAILEIFFYRELRKSSIKEWHEWNSYQSIHSVFPFIEDQFLHSNYILDTKIPYFLHPELLIRIFRRRIQDPFFLHSLRYIFHKNKKLIILDINSFFYQKEITRLSFFLWHSYIYELEFFLVNFWKKFNSFKSLSYLILLDQTNCIKKIQHIINPLWTKLDYFVFCKKKISFHYIKYQNNYILSIKGPKYLAEKWKFFFCKFWQYYFHFTLKPYCISIKKIYKNCFFFLGYLFGIRTKTSIVRTKMLNYLSKNSFANKEIYFITPISSLIGLLAKEKFCDILGHPISKLAWTTLTDDEIFYRFNQIWKSIFYYYSGCINKKNLYQIQYILRFSCAKTLACKHKSTIRFIWKKHDSNYFAKSFFFKKQELICSNFSKIYPFIKKIWYLDIIQIYSLANLLHKKK
uniref:Maturase K n=1 Tax=Tetraphis pellucida TaxID=37420 RepID=A0A0F7VJ49_9BRYO|nr:maturase K [Tetraphis pellucida]